MKIKLVSSALVAGLFASVAAAQTAAPGPQWSAYAGCWQAAAPEGQTTVTPMPEVCVVPSSNGFGADLLTLTARKITERTHVDADAVQHPVSREGCTGWEAARWSIDGRRLYFSSQQQCEGGVQRKGSGIFAIGADGLWTNVVNVSAGGGQGLRVVRYNPVTIDSTYPAEVVSAFGNRQMALGTARISARTKTTIDDILEANRAVDAAVVQGWVAASQQTFDLDAKQLIRLADAEVSPETIDIMIAVSNPKTFALAPRTAEGGGSSAEARRDAMRRDECYDRMMDPWGYDDYAFCDPYRRYGYYGSRLGYGLYGYDPYRNGYGYGYGFGYNSAPVVIVVKDGGLVHGKMTKNGYSNPGTSSSSATRDREPSRAPSSSSGSSGSSGSSSSGSSSSGSSGGSSSSGRTAHPKPPAR
jgi:hypothetical protein